MKTLIAFATLLPTLAFAGGSSVVGPGAPQFEYRCKDASENVQVDIVRTWPKYEETKLSVITYIPMTFTDEIVQKKTVNRPGAPVIYQGKRFELAVRASSPQFRDDKIFVKGFLKDQNSWRADQSLELECLLVAQK